MNKEEINCEELETIRRNEFEQYTEEEIIDAELEYLAQLLVEVYIEHCKEKNG